MKRFQTVASFLPVFLSLSLLLVFGGCASTGSTTADESSDEEEVNVGYAKQKKRDVTGSVTTISGEEQTKHRSPNRLSDMLRGNVAGVRVSEGPGGGVIVRIRGTSSIYGSNDPLYVVDGMPVRSAPGGSLPWINPYDVESITVLKDAAATSIYGSRGANGVIVIETKSAGGE